MASAKTYSTKELSGKRVVGGKSGDSRLGKVDRFVFHPSSKRCVGFLVKRPDLALMFHREDMFVPLDGFDIVDGRVALPYKDKEMEGRAAIKRLGLDWDSCVLWEGMPIVTENGTECGTVGDVVFSRATGKVISVSADKGATAKALLGEVVIPADMIRGFKTGMGAELAVADSAADGDQEADDEPLRGAILVSDSVLRVQTEGGLAETAGYQAAIAQDKVRRKVAQAKSQAKNQAKPKVDEATKAAGDAVGKGAYATGRQLRRAKGMFSAFKDEFDKAVSDDSGSSRRKKR